MGTAGARTTSPPAPDALAALVGHQLPGGVTLIAPHHHWLLNDVVLGDPIPGDAAHPLFVYLATDAMGVTWDEFFRLCGATADDGPMFGEHETEIRRPLRVGRFYTVTGEIVSAIRKSGRRTGVFDVVGYRLDLADDAGEFVASTTNSIVFPRRSLVAA